MAIKVITKEDLEILKKEPVQTSSIY